MHAYVQYVFTHQVAHTCTNGTVACLCAHQVTMLCSSVCYGCLCLVHAVSCEPSSTRFMTPFFGNMLGGTPITITLASGCSEQISGTPMCVFDDTETAAAVDDSGLAASGQHYFCSVPMFESAATLSFEFRAQLSTAGHGTLSLFGNFFLCECLSRSNCVMTMQNLIICLSSLLPEQRFLP